jgi:hypothetical protein
MFTKAKIVALFVCLFSFAQYVEARDNSALVGKFVDETSGGSADQCRSRGYSSPIDLAQFKRSVKFENGRLIYFELAGYSFEPIYAEGAFVGLRKNGEFFHVSANQLAPGGDHTVYLRNSTGKLIGTSAIRLSGDYQTLPPLEKEFTRVTAEERIASGEAEATRLLIAKYEIIEQFGTCLECDAQKDVDFAFCDTLLDGALISAGAVSGGACATGIGCGVGVAVGAAMGLVGLGTRYGCKRDATERWVSCKVKASC